MAQKRKKKNPNGLKDYYARIKRQKAVDIENFRDFVRDDALYLSDLYDELLEKTNKIFLLGIAASDVFPEEITKPYRHRLKKSGVNSVTLKRKIELINNYILEYYEQNDFDQQDQEDGNR